MWRTIRTQYLEAAVNSGNVSSPGSAVVAAAPATVASAGNGFCHPSLIANSVRDMAARSRLATSVPGVGPLNDAMEIGDAEMG